MNASTWFSPRSSLRHEPLEPSNLKAEADALGQTGVGLHLNCATAGGVCGPGPLKRGGYAFSEDPYRQRKGGQRPGQTRATRRALAAVAGPEPLPRTELTKRVWEYIRERKLQDAQGRRRIRVDDRLRAVLDGQDSVTMFELTKFVNRHLA